MAKIKRPSHETKVMRESSPAERAFRIDTVPSADARKQRHRSGWALWIGRMALALGVPVLLLVTLEAGLRLAGWGYPTAFCLRRGNVYIDNPRYLCQFYSRRTQRTNLRPTPFQVAVQKPADAVRIVVLGESAAAGAPEPAYSFSRILERMLWAECPGRHIEVINAAMRGVNSHIVLPTAKECLHLQPDLFVVYMGNNEAVGLHAPGPHSGRFTPHLRILRAVQWVRGTRLGQLMAPLLEQFNREGAGTDAQDNAFFQAHRLSADDPRRRAVYDNFAANLADVCRVAQQSRVKLVLATVAGNLMDCPPFGSLHRSDIPQAELSRWESAYGRGMQAEAAGDQRLALVHFAEARTIDDHYAELHFRIARCQYALGQFAEARTQYALACDWDALQFRTDSRENDTIRRQSSSATNRGAAFVDAERAFAASELADQNIPGARLFYDHVHFTFDGAYLLARTLFPAVTNALAGRLGPPANPSGPILSRDDCTERLAFTRINQAQIAAAVLRLTALPPFTSQLEHTERQAKGQQTLVSQFGNLTQADFETAAATFRAAISRAPKDWQLPYTYARTLLFPSHRVAEAIAQFETARQLLPNCLPIRLELSRALAAAGKQQEALEQVREALALDPKSEDAKAGLVAIQPPH
jgi:tetratricopeptide (TPR) repeat protein